MLHRYGFTEPDNPYDILNLDLELVLQWSSSRFSYRHSRRRLSLWRKLDYSGCVSQDSEYFEISYYGEPQIELIILLYILLLSEEAYSEVDLAVSTTDDVEKSWQPFLSKQGVSFENGSKLSKNSLLTESVCLALLSLADARESLYGSNSLSNDIKELNRCSQLSNPKLHHSLMLRISERKILQKLRSYASAGATKKGTKRKSKRRCMKTQATR